MIQNWLEKLAMMKMHYITSRYFKKKVIWYDKKYFYLNVSKTKEMCIDFRKNRRCPKPINIEGEAVERVDTFHHSHRTAVNNLLQSFHRRQLQIRYVLRCWLLINTGQYPRRRSEIPGTFWRHFRSQILEKPKICKKKVCYIRVLQCAYAPFRHLI